MEAVGVGAGSVEGGGVVTGASVTGGVVSAVVGAGVVFTDVVAGSDDGVPTSLAANGDCGVGLGNGTGAETGTLRDGSFNRGASVDDATLVTGDRVVGGFAVGAAVFEPTTVEADRASTNERNVVVVGRLGVVGRRVGAVTTGAVGRAAGSLATAGTTAAGAVVGSDCGRGAVSSEPERASTGIGVFHSTASEAALGNPVGGTATSTLVITVTRTGT